MPRELSAGGCDEPQDAVPVLGGPCDGGRLSTGPGGRPRDEVLFLVRPEVRLARYRLEASPCGPAYRFRGWVVPPVSGETAAVLDRYCRARWKGFAVIGRVRAAAAGLAATRRASAAKLAELRAAIDRERRPFGPCDPPG